MKFATVFASTLAAVAMASPMAKRQDTDYPDCETGKRALYLPDTVKVDEAFRVKYCSYTYFKTSPKQAFFAINRENTTDISGSVIYSTQDQYSNGYDFELTIPYNGNVNWPEQSFIQVVEEINDYYVPNSFTPVLVQAINIQASDN